MKRKMKKLGEGGFGTAYLTNDNKVLKITSNSKEFEFATDYINGNLDDHIKAVSCEIYDAYEKDGKFCIVKEFVKEVPSNDRGILDSEEKAWAWLRKARGYHLAGLAYIEQSDLNWQVGQRADGSFCFFDMMYS